jgi:transposase-like protein
MLPVRGTIQEPYVTPAGADTPANLGGGVTDGFFISGVAMSERIKLMVGVMMLLYQEGKSIPEISDILSINPATVRNKLKHNGITPEYRPRSSRTPRVRHISQRSKAIAEAYQSGLTLRQVALKFGVTYQRVHQCVKALDVKSRPSYRRGFVFNPDLDMVRSMRNEGASWIAVAEKMGVSAGILLNNLDAHEFARSERSEYYCRGCATMVPAERFYFKKTGNRMTGLCKLCRNKASMVWAKNNPDKRLEASRRFYNKHKAKVSKQ